MNCSLEFVLCAIGAFVKVKHLDFEGSIAIEGEELLDRAAF